MKPSRCAELGPFVDPSEVCSIGYRNDEMDFLLFGERLTARSAVFIAFDVDVAPTGAIHPLLPRSGDTSRDRGSRRAWEGSSREVERV